MKKKRWGNKKKGKGNKEEKFYTKQDIFLSRMGSILQLPQNKVRGYFSQRTISTIRLNSLLQSTNKTKAALEKLGIELVEVPWAKDVYTVLNTDKSELANLKLYKEGLFYIQNLSSLLPVLALDIQEEDLVLDMFAAPGTMSIHMAGLMNNKGRIIANDEQQFKTNKLNGLLKLFGVKNATIAEGKGERFGKKESFKYDKVLLHAPSSNEGSIYLKGNKPLRSWNIKKSKFLSNDQFDYIESAFKALKNGGTMVYSTSTLEPIENEGVITSLLVRFPNAEIQKIELFADHSFIEYRNFIKKGIVHWNKMDFDKKVKDTYRVIPGSKMMGLYVAKIKKN